MNEILQVVLIIATFLFCIFILYVTKKNKLSYKYTLLWLFFGIITLLCAIFPNIVTGISKIMHIAEPTNALFLIYIFLMIVIIFYISLGFTKISGKVTILIQENAMLAEKVDELEKQVKENNTNENN